MNNDFPRILTLLRKENHLSQKQAATDLDIAQALLSHYEKGKRECGLDFLVKVADYYHVSADYLLGRVAMPDGSTITAGDIPMPDLSANSGASLSVGLMKRILHSSIDVLYGLLGRVGSESLSAHLGSLCAMTLYRMFRIIYKTNPRNDANLFGISEDEALFLSAAGSSLIEGRAVIAAGKAEREITNVPEITTIYLEREYQKSAAALLNLVRNCESELKSIHK